jgi:hypothetical protein
MDESRDRRCCGGFGEGEEKMRAWSPDKKKVQIVISHASNQFRIIPTLAQIFPTIIFHL